MADRYLIETSAVDGYLLEDGTGVLILEQQAGTAPYFPVIIRSDAQRLEGIATRDALRARPKFYPFPYFEQPAPAPANPVIAILRAQWIGDDRVPLHVRPQFIPFMPPAPPEATANPVIPISYGRWIGDTRPPLIGTQARYLPFPYFVEPPLPANPVILFRVSPWLAFSQPEKRSNAWYAGKYQSPRFYPLIVFQLAPETYEPYEAFLQFDTTQYTPAGTLFFEVILKSLAGAEVKARLFNITDTAAVAGSEITTTSTLPVRLRSGSIALSGTKEYRAEVRVTAGETTTIKSARLIVQQ